MVKQNKDIGKKLKKPTIEELRKNAKKLSLRITEGIIEKIRKIHFKEGTGMPEMRKKLKNDFTKLGWLKNGRSKKGVSNLILNILGYNDWETYKINRSKIFEERQSSLPKKFNLKTTEGLSQYAKALDLDIKITPEIVEKIKTLHFEQGASIPKITIELQSELEQLGWIYEGLYRMDRFSKKDIPILRKRIPKFIIDLLGYSDFESYKKEQPKLDNNARNKLRYNSGFKSKLKKKIIDKYHKKCVICESNERLEVHHLDGNFENNEEENLRPVCKDCHNKIRKRLIYYDFENESFIEKPYYKIWKEEDLIMIKSFYDLNLNRIIKSSYLVERTWDVEQKVWIIEEWGFKFIQNKLIDYIQSTNRKYEFLSWVKKIELPKCSDVTANGYCNHAGAYSYGDKVKCTGADCGDYRPVGLFFGKK